MTRECYHEAAHACTALAKGVSVKRATRTYVETFKSNHHQPADAYMVHALAGGAAERHKFGTSLLDAQDVAQAREFCDVVICPKLDEAGRDEVFRRYGVLAELEVSRLWRWIEATAEALHRQGELTGYDIRALRDRGV
jgi:hypothetical protein